MWLVVTTVIDADGCHSDHYSAHETRAEAEAEYADALDSAITYSAHLCAPVRSTDYCNPLK
jgi:hypothetical protein